MAGNFEVRMPHDVRQPPGGRSDATLTRLFAVAGLIGFVLGILGTYTAYVVRGATAVEHAATFETSVDKRLVDAVARMDGVDRDRELRRNAAAARVDGLAATLHGRIDEVIKREDLRNEARNEAMNAVGLRVSGLEIKVCYLAGVRLAGCK